MCTSRRNFFRPLPGMIINQKDFTAEESENLSPSLAWERVSPEMNNDRSNTCSCKGNILPIAAVVFLLLLLFLAK